MSKAGQMTVVASTLPTRPRRRRAPRSSPSSLQAAKSRLSIPDAKNDEILKTELTPASEGKVTVKEALTKAAQKIDPLLSAAGNPASLYSPGPGPADARGLGPGKQHMSTFTVDEAVAPRAHRRSSRRTRWRPTSSGPGHDPVCLCIPVPHGAFGADELYDWNIVKGSNSDFVGLDNYVTGIP